MSDIVAQPSNPDANVDQPPDRMAAAAKIREMARKLLPDKSEEAAPEPSPEPAVAEPEASAEESRTVTEEAKTAPEPQETPEREQRLKPSQLREIERRQRAAERHRQEAERTLLEARAERQRFAAEQKALQEDRARLEEERNSFKRWDEEARRAPLQKMAERWGMKPEELAASFADDKANALSPEIAARFSEMQLRLESETKERQRLENDLKNARTRAKEIYEQRQREADLQHDVRMVARDVLQERGDDFVHFAALPDETRQQRARYAVLAATELMQKTGDEITYQDVLEVLEDQAQREWDAMSKNERLKTRYATPPSGGAAKAKPGASAGSVPAKLTNRTPSAKDAAVPGEPRETTLEDRRRAAARKLRELRGDR